MAPRASAACGPGNGCWLCVRGWRRPPPRLAGQRAARLVAATGLHGLVAGLGCCAHGLAPRVPAWLGVCHGMAGGHVLVALYLHAYLRGLAAALAAATVLALAAFLGSYYAGFRFCKALAPGPCVDALLVWLLAELARGVNGGPAFLGRRGYASNGGAAGGAGAQRGVRHRLLCGCAGHVAGTGYAAATCAILRAWALALGVLVLAGGAALQRHCAVERCQTPTAPAAPAPPGLVAGHPYPAGRSSSRAAGCHGLQWYGDRLTSLEGPGRCARNRDSAPAPAAHSPLPQDASRSTMAQQGQATLLGIPAGQPGSRLHQFGGALRPVGRCPTGTTNTIWCRLANSSRRSSAGSPSA